MAEEENSQKCSDRSSFVSASLKKATKQRKVPQRGLGVAQLEKIRLEEQNKKIQIPPPNSTNSSSDFKPNEVLSPSSPSPTTIDLPLFRPPIQIDVPVRPNLSKNTNWWNAELSEGLLPSFMHRSPFSSSMVNVSSGTSSSSVMSYQIEPPSNQSYCGTSNNNNYTTLVWPPDEKMMVGMKRQYPFCIDNAPGPCFPRFPNPPSTSFSHIPRPEELASCSYGFASPNIEPPIPVFREMPSGIGRNPKRNRKDNAGLNGDFLTLGPPAMTPQNWRLGHFLPSDIPEYESLPYHQDPFPVTRPIPGPSVLIQRPYISFLPAVENQNGSLASSSSGSSDGENRESVDLNLKL